MAVITPVTIVGPYPALQPSATDLDFAFTACSGGADTFAATDKDILIVTNTNGAAAAKTFTITSVVDDINRTGDITTYSVGDGLFSVFSFRNGMKGWRNGSGNITITGEDADIEFAILRTAV